MYLKLVTYLVIICIKMIRDLIKIVNNYELTNVILLFIIYTEFTNE